jgi:hypothetical protein
MQTAVQRLKIHNTTSNSVKNIPILIAQGTHACMPAYPQLAGGASTLAHRSKNFTSLATLCYTLPAAFYQMLSHSMCISYNPFAPPLGRWPGSAHHARAVQLAPLTILDSIFITCQYRARPSQHPLWTNPAIDQRGQTPTLLHRVCATHPMTLLWPYCRGHFHPTTCTLLHT